MATELREKYLFVIKYFGQDSNLDGCETVADVLTSLEASYTLSIDSTVDGWIGVVNLLGSETSDFFHAIRSLTARINGNNKTVSDVKELSSAGRMTFPSNPAKWAQISFTKLVECFTFIGNPDANLDTNDYCIVPPGLHKMMGGADVATALALEREAAALEEEAPLKKVGMLGGIGGHQGD